MGCHRPLAGAPLHLKKTDQNRNSSRNRAANAVRKIESRDQPDGRTRRDVLYKRVLSSINS